MKSGTCGENLTYQLDEDGTLIIDATGYMNNYRGDNIAWWQIIRAFIKKIIIKNGVTSIGDYAFAYCANLTSVEIPHSVAFIGEWAFYRCHGLYHIVLPYGVKVLCSFSFSDYKNLERVFIAKK